MSEEGKVENCGNDMRLEGLTTINEYPPTSLTVLNEESRFIIQITSSRMDKVDSTRFARCNPSISCLVRFVD
jgi:hypothetical protein